jgi:hypothetical protein
VYQYLEARGAKKGLDRYLELADEIGRVRRFVIDVLRRTFPCLLFVVGLAVLGERRAFRLGQH